MYSVSYNDAKFDQKLHTLLNTYGIAVVTDVFEPSYCNQKMADIIASFEQISPQLDHTNLSTWRSEYLPPQTRPGMYQSMVGHLQPVWDLRGDEKVRRIFHASYKGFRKTEPQSYTVSFDGINIQPPISKVPKEKPDWAHLDQTIRDEPFLCFQGQAVLTNTSAAFRCTPGSHRYYSEILDLVEAPKNKSNWCKFKDPEVVQKFCQERKLDWQIPLYAPQGSFILWTSSTIHSAVGQSRVETPDVKDPWKGWRGVVYICYRPRDEMSKIALKKRAGHVESNRTTSHWGEKLFPKVTRWYQPIDDNLKLLSKQPEKISDILGPVKAAQDLI